MSTDHYIKIRRYLNPLLIGISPVTVLAGTFVVPVLGFLIGLGIMSSVFLQTPVKKGGYGFTPLQNAACKLPTLPTHCELPDSCP